MSAIDTIHEVSRLTSELTPKFGSRWLAFREACGRHGLKVPESTTANSQPAKSPIVKLAEKRAAVNVRQPAAAPSPLQEACNLPQSKAQAWITESANSPIVRLAEKMAAAHAEKQRDQARTTEHPGRGSVASLLERAVERRIAAGR